MSIELLEELIITMEYAQMLITSRQEMHSDGIKLYAGLILKLKSLHKEATGG